MYLLRFGIEIVFTQMTKTDVLATGAEGDHVPDLHLVIGYDHAIDEEFDQLPLLLKGGLGQALLHPLTEIFDRGDPTGQFGLPVHLGRQLLRLLLQRGQALL
jgi:hypothetical protein